MVPFVLARAHSGVDFLQFGLFGLHFLLIWPFGPLFPFGLAFSAFISFHFGLLGLHFLLFWPFGALFPSILAFCGFISFHFRLLGLPFFSFWPFGPSFPFILAFWVSFPFFHFWLVWAATWGPPRPLPKMARFLMKFKQILSAPRPAAFCNLRPKTFPFILAFWAFISFHFDLLGFHFLSFWPFRPLFPFILSFWAFISFHFGLLGLHFLHFWLVGGATWGPPTSCQKRPVS